MDNCNKSMVSYWIQDKPIKFITKVKVGGTHLKKNKKGFPAAKTVPIEMFTYQQLRILERSLIMIAFMLEQPIYTG